ncbi:MAG: hypothetical protein IJH84_18950, partial [Saccharopolyspora sp.]|uniref:hypothetical protein n=1 Tax=Saccharopolyspora sp. TaxID=33915 RepID=UPI0025F9C009
HEPGPIITGDGRQSMFRGNAAPSIPGDAGFEDSQVRMRFAIPARDDRGIADDVDFFGQAEIVVQDVAGAETVLGTFDAGSQSWTPTDAGRRWLQDSQ